MLRRLFFVTGTVVLMCSATGVLTSTRISATEVCCVDTDECPTGYRCRMPDGVPCSPSAIGMCVPVSVGG
jgi:hypothetical protein